MLLKMPSKRYSKTGWCYLAKSKDMHTEGQSRKRSLIGKYNKIDSKVKKDTVSGPQNFMFELLLKIESAIKRKKKD